MEQDRTLGASEPACNKLQIEFLPRGNKWHLTTRHLAALSRKRGIYTTRVKESNGPTKVPGQNGPFMTAECFFTAHGSEHLSLERATVQKTALSTSNVRFSADLHSYVAKITRKLTRLVPLNQESGCRALPPQSSPSENGSRSGVD